MYDPLNEHEPPQPRRSLKKDAAFVYAGYFLRYLSLIILIPYYGRVLGPASYGKVLAAMSVMNIVWMVVNYAFSITGAREMASADGRAERTRIFGQQLAARFLLVPIGLVIGIAGGLISPVLSSNIWFGVLATMQGLLAAFNLGWFFQGVRRFRTGMAVEALSYPVTLILVLLMVRNSEDGVNVMVALVLSSIICLAVAYYYSTKSSGISLGSVKSGIAEIKGASVLFLSSISGILMTSGSTYLLSLLAAPAQVGYFGAAERFVALGLGLLGPMGQVLMPTISNLHAGSTQKAFHLARKGMMLELAYGSAVLIGGVTLSPFILPIIMGPAFGPSIPILQILSCLFPFAAFNHAVALYILIPLRKEKYLVAATTAGMAVNLLVAVFTVPAMGAMGMAIARLCAEIMGCGALMVITLRYGLLKKVLTSKGH